MASCCVASPSPASRFQDERGWYPSTRRRAAACGAHGARPYAPLAFDVCTEAEAGRSTRARAEAAKGPEQRHRRPQVTTARSTVTTDDLPSRRPPTFPRRLRGRRRATSAASASSDMYASVADLRAEGVTATDATPTPRAAARPKPRPHRPRVAGWFFEPRLLTLRLSGRSAERSGFPCRRSASTGSNFGGVGCRSSERTPHRRAPIQPGFDGPLHAVTGACSRGHGNVTAGALGLHRGTTTARSRAHAASDPPRDDAPRPSLDRAARRRRLVRGAGRWYHRGADARPELPARPAEAGVGEPHRRPEIDALPCALREASPSERRDARSPHLPVHRGSCIASTRRRWRPTTTRTSKGRPRRHRRRWCR